jgi:ABC-type glycerol-3-phosphate transport system substrate-binding protein
MNKYNKKPVIFLMALILLFSFSMFLFPVKAYNTQPKTSQGVDLTIIMLGDQQVPGVENVTDEFLASVWGTGVDTVTVESSGADASAQLTNLQTDLQANTLTSHVIAIDVVWTAPFVKNGWLVNLDPYITDVDLNDYGSGIVAATEYQGHHYAFPYFMNLGVLYYRTDLLDLHMPGWTTDDFATWEGLNDTANFILNNESGLLTPDDANLVGYIGQMDAYEGGVVNFFEWCGSNGALNLVTSSGDVNIDTPAVNDAMDFLAALVPPQYTGVQGTPYIIPRYGLVYDEASSANKWLANESIFLRQWPYVYALSEANHMDFGLAPLPYFEGATGYKTSAVGGAILAVPTVTTGTARQAAINFTKFLGMQAAQESELTADTDPGPAYTPQGNFPALLSVYDNPPTGFDYIKNWSAQAELTLSRPVNPDYPLISNTIAGYFSNLLSGVKTVSDALGAMQKDVSEIVAPTVPEPAIPGFSIAIVVISVAFTIGIIVFAKRKRQ